LDVARVREDDELAEQPEREQLHPEHHEERGQEQRRPVSERMAEDEAVDRKPGDEQRAHEERRHPHHSEESQRLLREAHEEEHRADIEHPADVLPQPIATLQAIERRLPQLDLSHFEADTARQHRQEAMLVAVDIDLVEHPALHRPRAAAEVVEALAGDPCQEAMEEIPPKLLEAAARPWPAPPDREVGSAQRAHQSADLATADLVVRRQCENGTATRALESGNERGGFAKPSGEADHRDPLSRGEQPLYVGGYFRPRAVEHDDNFVGRANRLEPLFVFGVEGKHVSRMTHPNRNDHGDLDAYG